MPAPADHQVGTPFVLQHASIAQDVIHRVGNARRIVQIEAAAAQNGIMDVDDVAQYREQMLLDAADHLAVDEGARRRVAHFELHAPRLPAETNLEIAILIEDGTGIVSFIARSQYGERALAEELVDAAFFRR